MTGVLTSLIALVAVVGAALAVVSSGRTLKRAQGQLDAAREELRQATRDAAVPRLEHDLGIEPGPLSLRVTDKRSSAHLLPSTRRTSAEATAAAMLAAVEAAKLRQTVHAAPPTNAALAERNAALSQWRAREYTDWFRSHSRGHWYDCDPDCTPVVDARFDGTTYIYHQRKPVDMRGEVVLRHGDATPEFLAAMFAELSRVIREEGR